MTRRFRWNGLEYPSLGAVRAAIRETIAHVLALAGPVRCIKGDSWYQEQLPVVRVTLKGKKL